MAKRKLRHPSEITAAAVKRIRDGKKITWLQWSLMVAEITGMYAGDVELVLRAAAELLGPEQDFDCELSNEVATLKPNWSEWDPRPGAGALKPLPLCEEHPESDSGLYAQRNKNAEKLVAKSLRRKR